MNSRIFVETKISNWIKDVENLAEIAAEEPQAAFVAFNVGMSNRWSFLQRTLQGIAELFKPLEDAIRNKLIPAIVGREVSNTERKMISLPYRYGGLGIQIPNETADREFESSSQITKELTRLITSQAMDFDTYDQAYMRTTKLQLKNDRKQQLKQESQAIIDVLPEAQRIAFKFAQEKGASAWLSALPLQ